MITSINNRADLIATLKKFLLLLERAPGTAVWLRLAHEDGDVYISVNEDDSYELFIAEPGQEPPSET